MCGDKIDKIDKIVPLSDKKKCASVVVGDRGSVGVS